MIEVKNIKVRKNDLKRIGNTASKTEYGTLELVCNAETANIEVILLRNILLCFGEQYEILSEEDFVWESGKTDIAIRTNLPYSMYEVL